MPILPTAQEMRSLEAQASEACGIPEVLLMENAGEAAATIILSRSLSGIRTLCLCGTGNNGGDGYVVARHLVRAGQRVRVFSVGDQTRETPLARFERQYFCQWSGQEVLPWQAETPIEVDCIVDAVLGAGLRGQPRSPAKECIAAINQARAQGAQVYALDLPSGLGTSFGAVTQDCVEANHTITFGFPKYGMQSAIGRAFCGTMSRADIFLPPVRENTHAIIHYWYTAQDAIAAMPQRPLAAHKGTLGRVMLLAGSATYPGAAVMAAQGALASGCALVYLAVPESIISRLHGLPADIILHGLPDEGKGMICPAMVPVLVQLRESVNSLVLGPGLGAHPDTIEALVQLAPHLKPGLVIDADGLRVLTKDRVSLPANTVLTPHAGEFSAITKLPAQITDQVQQAASTLAKQKNLLLVVKDASTMVATPEGKILWVTSGHPVLARGGMGDILAGLIGGLIARGMSSDQAAVLAVWVHGAAAWQAKKEAGESITAADLITALPVLFGQIASGQNPGLESEPQDALDLRGGRDGSKT